MTTLSAEMNEGCYKYIVNTLRTGDADLRF